MQSMSSEELRISKSKVEITQPSYLFTTTSTAQIKMEERIGKVKDGERIVKVNEGT